MDLSLAVRGFILGCSVAAVVGPIALLCLRRTLTGGFLVGFLSGLGAATADASYAAIGGSGISAAAALLVEQRLWLRLLGGLFLIHLAVRTLRAVPAQSAAVVPAAPGLQLLAAYTSTLALTISNPMTILSFGAIFAGMGLGALGADSPMSALLLVGGVFVGSTAWWLILAAVAARLRSAFTPRRLRLVNIGSGLLFLGFGVQAVAAAVFEAAA
ncbi:MAG TPA: LysE family transporter [Chloroflexota bacterium]|nr:LysE family transporter [Chloroflexota bacterium]